MATFTLDSSKLAGGQFATQMTPLTGEFGEIQFRWSQAGSARDLELHFAEFHYTFSGISEESR